MEDWNIGWVVLFSISALINHKLQGEHSVLRTSRGRPGGNMGEAKCSLSPLCPHITLCRISIDLTRLAILKHFRLLSSPRESQRVESPYHIHSAHGFISGRSLCETAPPEAISFRRWDSARLERSVNRPRNGFYLFHSRRKVPLTSMLSREHTSGPSCPRLASHRDAHWSTLSH